MNQEQAKYINNYLQTVKMFVQLIMPWKKNDSTMVPVADEDNLYYKGWNACLKEIRKRITKYKKQVESYAGEQPYVR